MAAAKGTRPPRAGLGRPKGTPNKTTTTLKQAILLAAQTAGQKLDPKTEDGLATYLTDMAVNDRPLFVPLLGRVLPIVDLEDAAKDASIKIEIVKRTYAEDDNPPS